jgi:hypothetical protein
MAARDGDAAPHALSVTCPTCRAAAGSPCAEDDVAHPSRVLAAKALRQMPAAREAPSAEEKMTKAARLRQRARARDPRMNNDW